MSDKVLRFEYKTILIDFDGTCVAHMYPKIGFDIGAVPVLKKLVENGHRLILFTMRGGRYLVEAVEWFRTKEIPLYGIQTNPNQKTWTDSPKAHGDMIIDDTSLFMPLKDVNGHIVCDWEQIEIRLKEINLIK